MSRHRTVAPPSVSRLLLLLLCVLWLAVTQVSAGSAATQRRSAGRARATARRLTCHSGNRAARLRRAARGCSRRSGRHGHAHHASARRHKPAHPQSPPSSSSGTDGKESASVEGASSQPGGLETSPAAIFAPRLPAFFATSSFWNAPLSVGAALDPDSPALVAELLALVNTEVTGKWGPYISTVEYSTPIYTVPADQPDVLVKEVNEHPSATLQTSWDSVPLPANAQPAAGSDAQLTVWQPSTDRLWEFWHASHQEGGWQAQWGGTMENVSSSPGYFTTSSWPGAQLNWGATATSLPLVGGLITFEDLARHEIDHALSFSLPVTRAGVWSWPAQRSDGSGTGVDNIPEGTRFRLEPTLDVAALNLPPLVRMMAVAAQRYGIVVHDKSGVVDFYGQDPTPTEANPWPAVIGGEPIWQMMSKFPWSHLEALTLTSCSKQPCPVPPGQ
jgi:hypothetical protein